jgi:acetyl-CoA carboxylase carboxyl transferase subunit alpha
MAESLDFEAPLIEIQNKIETLKADPSRSGKDLEIKRLQKKLDKMRGEIFRNLSPWQKVQLARHPQRPYLLDFIKLLFDDFLEIHGDRRFSDDPAIVAGMAWFRGQPVMVVGHQKGRDAKERIYRNFGMARPEGYRKALRVMRLAEKFHRPIFCFVDTMGAYPGMDAEDRGQSEAIAYNIREIAQLDTPILVTVTGEGGSGGALAIAIGDEILMMENAIYSVISPEGCASILWRDAGQAESAATALKITAGDLLKMGLVDQVVPEPPGGAHSDHKATVQILADSLSHSLERIEKMTSEERLEARYQKFRRMGEIGLESVAGG